MYEYKTLAADGLPSEASLNDLGKEGWKMVQLVKHGQNWVLYLVRPLSN